ncbi:MAG: hypothetical protein AAF611_23005, partial [Bacteroidota bacterium]
KLSIMAESKAEYQKILKNYQELTGNWQELLNDKDGFSKTFIHLNSGFIFPLAKKQYEEIINKYPEILENRKNDNGTNKDFMNYYFGIEEGKFVILMIDSISDRNGNIEMVFKVTFGESLITKYRQGIEIIFDQIDNLIADDKRDDYPQENRISALRAMDRFLKWSLFGQEWVENYFSVLKDKKNNEGKEDYYFPVIRFPFSGIKELFDKKEKPDTLYHFFGLKKKQNVKKNNIENPIETYDFDLLATANSDQGFPNTFSNFSCICEADDEIKRSNEFSLLPSQYQ